MLSWEQKIRSWLPKHYNGVDNDAIIKGMAIVFTTLEGDLNDYITQTFITEANTEYLNVHGKERGFARITNESDTDYANRIRRIKYNRSHQNIIENVQSVLGITNVRVIDDYETDLLDNMDSTDTDVVISGGTFGNQGPIDLKKRFNCFSVVLDAPKRPPFAFYDDVHDAQGVKPSYDLNEWYDVKEKEFNSATAKVIFNLIKLKAPAGSGFRLLVKDFDGITIGTTAQQEQRLNEGIA